MASRTARRLHLGPYRAAVIAPISHQNVTLSPNLAAQVDDATHEVARFDAELGYEIAPFSAVLLRSESAASSKIEHLTAPAKAIAQAELTPNGRNNAAAIVANTRAMTAAIALSGHISAEAILRMHAELLTTSAPSIAGRWRDQQVWIGGGDLGPHQAAFVPPHHRHIPAAIADLLYYIDRDDVPVLLHAAIAHAQFETIHPFADGNGRTGRALLHAHLRNKHLTRNLTVPVSAGLLTATDAYFDALSSYRAGEPQAIVEQIVHAAFAAITNGRHLVHDLRDIRQGWNDAVMSRRGTNTWRIADLLLRHPVINAALVNEQLGILTPNIYRSLSPLLDAGVLTELTTTRRHQMWQAPQVLRALDRFAARAGRRGRTSH